MSPPEGICLGSSRQGGVTARARVALLPLPPCLGLSDAWLVLWMQQIYPIFSNIMVSATRLAVNAVQALLLVTSLALGGARTMAPTPNNSSRANPPATAPAPPGE